MKNDDSESLIDQLYEAAVVPELWPGVLEAMSRQTDAALGSLFLWREGVQRFVGTPLAAASQTTTCSFRQKLNKIRSIAIFCIRAAMAGWPRPPMPRRAAMFCISVLSTNVRAGRLRKPSSTR